MNKYFSRYVIILVAILVLTGGFFLFGSYFEIGKPGIRLSEDLVAIGRQKVIEITFSDSGSGLRETTAVIVQDNKPYPLSSVGYPQKKTSQKLISMTVDPYEMKMHDGPAVLQLKAVDYSLFKNETVISRPVSIDITPPQIYPQNPQNILNPGGTGVTLFRTSEPTLMSGVMVENQFFRSYPILVSGKLFQIAYFALPVDARQGATRIKIFARDTASNEASLALPHLIKSKKFRYDKMNLSDNFLQQKMPDFQISNPELRGKTMVETFIHVNGQMRQDNMKTIQAVTGKSEPKQLWQDTFLRMKNASPMALFGDARTYSYQGKAISESLHEGVDLASTEHAPIEAANDGVVVFAGPLGIYGNAVIIDHGLGLFSLYGHQSTIHVKTGQPVKKGDGIGNSGITGLAGGDHLHFSIIVGDRFVNPQEWWDPHWIADNVTKKIAQAN
jgi:murein DD-endopeptidase MepM/ murein hydrolase activator NlpD